MKRFGGLLLLSIFLLSFSIGFVSANAAGDFVRNALDTGYGAVTPLISDIIGDTPSGELFLAKVLFLIIISIVVWLALSKVEFFTDYPVAQWLVTIAVSILSIRWIVSNDIIESMLLPYSALGISIAAGIPFFLAFIIIKGMKTHTGRVFAWSLFIAVFGALWIIRADEVPKFAFVYLVAAGLALICLFFDGTIQQAFAKMKVEKVGAYHRNKAVAELHDLQDQVTDRYTKRGKLYESIYDSAIKGIKGYDHDIDEIKKRIATFRKK